MIIGYIKTNLSNNTYSWGSSLNDFNMKASARSVGQSEGGSVAGW